MLNYMNPVESGQGCGPLLDPDDAKAPSLRQQIFQHVRAHGRAARTDISQGLQISAGSTTTLTADLIAEGLLCEVDDAARETGRGRPRVALQVVPEAAYVIGIKLSTKLHSAVLCDFAGTVVASATVTSINTRRSLKTLFSEIVPLIDTVIKNAKMKERDIRAIGIGLPGIVDQDTSLIRWSSLLDETNIDFLDVFSQRYDMPLLLDNDTNMLTLAELWFGLGRSKTEFAVVTIENGVGMGLVVNNRLYRGAHGIGLELGHTKVELDGALCRCGQRGCLEAYLGDYALTREIGIALGNDVVLSNDPESQLKILLEKAKSGHDAAETIFRRAGRYLSIGLSNVVQLFDPSLIIISGDRSRYDYLFSKQVLADMQKMTLSEGRQPCKIEFHAWDDMVWARGATVPALMALTDVIVGGLEMQAR